MNKIHNQVKGRGDRGRSRGCGFIIILVYMGDYGEAGEVIFENKYNPYHMYK